MTRLIDADKLYPDCLTKEGTLAISQSQIANAPTVEVDKLILIVAKRHGKREMMLDALRPHGKWVRTALYGQTCLQCNQCGKADFDIKYDKYCPNCGAKMDKKEGEKEADNEYL